VVFVLTFPHHFPVWFRGESLYVKPSWPGVVFGPGWNGVVKCFLREVLPPDSGGGGVGKFSLLLRRRAVFQASEDSYVFSLAGREAQLGTPYPDLVPFS